MLATVKPNKSGAIRADPQPIQLLDVPAALLTSILSHVPLQDRLGVCTRVCRSFQAAAVAATNSISTTSMNSQARCDSVIKWLQRHGGGVTALESQRQGYRQHLPCLASLPCPLLTGLNLYGLSLQPGFFSACTGLTKLRLEVCCVEDSPRAPSSAASNPLLQLSVLSSLQHMSLRAVRAGCSATNSQGTVLDLPSSLLSQLVELTYLQLGLCQVQSDAALQHLHALTALQHLDLDVGGLGQQQPTEAALTGLQHLKHLTALKMRHVRWAIDLHSMPAVTALTALRVLQLWDITSVDPAVLAGFSQLQELDLECRQAWDAEGSAVLLAAIGQQPQLKGLQLSFRRIWRPPSAAAFSALTASSHLQHLKLAGLELPAYAWQQMFLPGRCLPALRFLWWQSEDNGAGSQQLSPAGMQAMVSCCPALASLDLGSQLAVSSIAPLRQLTSLTHLSMCASFEDNAASIARLTGWQRLHLNAREAGERVTVSGLLQLTVLQQLRYIAVTGADFDPGLAAGLAVPEQGCLRNCNKVRMAALVVAWIRQLLGHLRPE